MSRQPDGLQALMVIQVSFPVKENEVAPIPGPLTFFCSNAIKDLLCRIQR